MANWDCWIIDRYLAGEATVLERIVVERRLARSSAFRALLAEVNRRKLDEAAIDRAAVDVRARFERDLLADAVGTIPAIGRRHGQPYHPPRLFVQPTRLRGTGLLRSAAMVTLVLGGSLAISQASQYATVSLADAGLRAVTAPAKRRVSLTLPDGSHVMLSPGSTVRYAPTFGSDPRRHVQLEGEAYFDVRHDGRRPFVVSAGTLVAEDLGTQFVIRAYPEDAFGRVVVREGIVSIGHVVVGPGEIGWLAADGRPNVAPADTASWFAWTHGRLAFAGMPLREALPKLSRWYDLEFRLAEPALGDVELVGTVPELVGEDAVHAISLAFGLQAVRDGKVVTFRRAH